MTGPLADTAAEDRVQGAIELLRQSTAQRLYQLALDDLVRANAHSRACRQVVRDALAELTAARQAVHRRWSDSASDTHDDAEDGPRETCIGCRP